ncbi:MAG: T9SS type A sorting domain-containing protein [candidate division KSB1 bacterium]|nr:T9SS type A sorting domain-containing protein [candidate division KSB1 bacterium]MDZ7364906.1 T9SS type A sorting domain-containing protein [candidate division KSB1 bacterium]MDZ7403008.1 T9SS type A sorting domain-containing protein [candidate division KSB1 bacterium]
MHRIFLWLILCALPLPILAQPPFVASLYPPQHGLNIPADAVLRVGLQTPIDPASLSDSSVYVWSDITGLHKLIVTLENGDKDLRIVPRHWRLNDCPPFNAGERVTVTLTTRLRYADGRPFEGFTWHYTVAVRQFRGGDFSPLMSFGGGGSSYFYASDFNGDGWCDLVGNDDGIERKLIVFLNDRQGKLLFKHVSNVIGSNGEVTDFDKDGDQDIFYGFQRAILNDGAGKLTQKDYLDWPNGQGKAHDFNNDGLTDYVIGYVLSDTLYFGLSQSGKSFKKLQKVLAAIRRPLFYVHGISYDLNNDGQIDFLYVGGSTKENIAPGFTSFQATTADSLRVLQVVKDNLSEFYGNDLDADGDIDYLFIYGDPIKSAYVTLINDGNGQLKLTLPPPQPNSTFANTVEGGDFDGDGDIDLALPRNNLVSVMPERYAPDISILLNDGKGNFFLASRIRLPFARGLSRMLRAVDLDLDGDLDLIGVAEGLFYVVANGGFATAIAQEKSLLPAQFNINPIYPNPAKERIKIELTLPANVKREEISINIFDLTGRLIRSWRFNEYRQSIRLNWDLRDQTFNLLPNGIYLVKAQMGQLHVVQKIAVVK